MVDGEVNPLEKRHLALSTRFKAAWAFHQLLQGMHRLNNGGRFENRTEKFQPLFTRLKSFAESLHGATTGLDPSSSAEIGGLEREVEELVSELTSMEEGISPSELRRFFNQVRSLDDRILIEVVRFYLEIQRGREWPRDRLDKTDFLISRLAERIAGADLQGDRRRLDKVLHGLLATAELPAVSDQELEGLVGTLQDLRSEVRWVKTFEELNESRRVEVYRALKHDMAARMFHPRVLPLVVEVNNAFRRKIDDLRAREEIRLIEDYQQLSELQALSQPEAELQAELVILQDQVEEFRDRAKSNNVRISELVVLGDSLRDIASRLQAQGSPSDGQIPMGNPLTGWSPGGGGARRTGLLPDLDCLQPHWSALLKALSGLDVEIAAEQATSETSLAVFRLERREVEAFRATVAATPMDPGPDPFVLAAAALRRRICQDVEELRALQSRKPGSLAERLIQRVRETVRIADSYVKHFSHLIDQAVFGGEMEEARDYQILQTRLLRESTGLVILIPGESALGSKRSVGKPVTVVADREVLTASDGVRESASRAGKD